MSRPILQGRGDISTLKYIITHVFCPLRLPDQNDHSLHNDLSLVGAVSAAALHLYSHSHVDPANLSQWKSVCRMLESLRISIRSESLHTIPTIFQSRTMDVGDVLALPVRAQNAGVVFRRQKDVTIFESFELSPKAQDVMSAEGKLICSYPGPAIKIPNPVFDDENFQSELENFLVCMNHDYLETATASTNEGDLSSVFRDSVHPRYITELLTGILRSVGRPAHIPRISKRVGDDALCNDGSGVPWRRSPIWLLIRVSLQTTLDRSPLGHNRYKEFMLFFMCLLADEKHSAELPSDLLQFMAAKISRRLRKLGSSAPDWLSSIALQTCTSLRHTIETRWNQVQDTQRQSPLWAPSRLQLAADIRLSLLHSREYLRNSLANHTTSNTPFNPNHRRRGTLGDFLSSDGKFFEEAYRTEPLVTLYDVECAVEQGIDAWVDRVTQNGAACETLELLADKYSSRASETYANNPELLSIMLLTTIELWIALDKVAIKEIPILAAYSPEVPTSLLESLLLCRTVSLRRLQIAHEYLSRRHSQSRNHWSVFSSIITADSFSVRFYKEHLHQQQLKTRIEAMAKRQVREKLAELWKKNARWAVNSNWISSLRSQRVTDTIGIHEWPLPADRLQAEVVVFELDCPVSFNMWRTATFHLLVDLCSPSMQQANGPGIRLSDYEALTPYLVEHPRSRISLGSNSRSFSLAHCRELIPVTRTEVCIKNGLTYFPYDKRTGVHVSQALGRSDSRLHCTYNLPSGPYENLQQYVYSTSHTSNEVIANQADCNKDLSIHEYMAFGHLRSGGLLQWLNILRELRSRSINLRRKEVHMLIAQAVSQVGPLENADWAWHMEIAQPTFCLALLEELRSLVRDVEANWKEGVTMDTISLLLRRLLVSNPSLTVSRTAIDLLRTVRGKVFSWVQKLAAELAKTPKDEEFRGILRDTAAICRSTFDVEATTISELLHSQADIEVFLSCAIIIHDHVPSDVSSLSTFSRLLLDRDRRLSLALESLVSNMIQANSNDQGINLAVGMNWPDYHPGSKWSRLPGPNSRWFSSMTAPPTQAGRCPQAVHINILDGSLLINGKSLGMCLPDDFVQHPLYKLIFGGQILEILPSDLPGMDYCTRNLISNHLVYFCLTSNGEDLIIRAIRHQTIADDSEVVELIPHEQLEGDVPGVLVEGHAHWLNLSTSVLEVRPLDRLWEASPDNWKIDFTPGCYRMRKGHEYLVDIRSQSWDMVSRLMKPLCAPRDLIVSVSPVDSKEPTASLQLSVALPRYDLSFFVDEDGDLQSRNVRGMIYDENQSIGTLFGLVNQLVLRPKLKDANVLEFVPRYLLIPEGDISFQTDGYHVRVEIIPRRHVLDHAPYHTYRVNADLGCLTGNSSLTSKLYCAYLHALTSGCSVDPLTSRTGTEEALSLLQSASSWSSLKFSSRDAELLDLIALMCPSRAWSCKRSVQKVEWRDLPTNSQHHDLYLFTKAIKGHYARLQAFHENPSSFSLEDFPFQDDHLLKRSARRTMYLFPFDFPQQDPRADSDVQYSGRDLLGLASREHDAYTAATYVYHRTAMGTTDIWQMVKSWKNLSGVSRATALSLRYDISWLSPVLPKIWLNTYNLLRRGDDRKWFQLLFSLPAMVYASPNLGELVPILVAFASHKQFFFEDPPHYDSYPIVEGCYLSDERSHDRFINYLEHPSQGPSYGKSVHDSDASAIQGDQEEFKSYFPNCTYCTLKEHVQRVQSILNTLQHSHAPNISLYTFGSFLPSQSVPSCISWQLTIGRLLIRPAPLLREPDILPRYAADSRNISLVDSDQLRQFITTVAASAVNPFRSRYVLALYTSAESFKSEMSSVNYEAMELPTAEILVENYAKCKVSYIQAHHHLLRCLGPSSKSEQAVEISGQWPGITSQALFRFLASNSPITLPEDWKKCLITFILHALEVQRARRLVLLHFNGNREELWRELQNEGCDGWDDEAHPDWLLIQLQGNFLIRGVQAEVAHEMISPRSGNNTAMQLNMGEGKTSVIVPIASVSLANGDQLVRVIVPKPLTTQTIHLLVDRLGGLTNRRIYYLPFSRTLQLDDQKVASLHDVMLECMKVCGILVVQPDHVLSLKLVSAEKQLSWEKERRVADLLLNLQRWLHSHSRDILDECDEILDVRSQLVFTLGSQRCMEGSPERWTTTQQVLGLVSKRASSLQDLFPLGVEHAPGPPGSFPHLRILHSGAGKKLISWIIEDIMEGRLTNISVVHLLCHSDLMDAIRSFLSCEEVPPAKAQLVKECLRETSLWCVLLLLRGLLATGILLFPFRERRWRVDYGLAPMRTMLAVPYRAKDVPARKAEFGHPDIAIILTCLSYYYAGLTEEQLVLSFEILFKQHDPSLEYDIWVRACPAVPESLQTLSGVNLQSVEQRKNLLFPFFSRNRSTVDFYLSRVVFPREAKEFPSKLSSSGWDLAEKKKRLLTGFSGTNDGQCLLPLHITQHDPNHQRGTNAKVLSYLLQPENKHYMCMANKNGERRTTREFLRILAAQKPEIRVLLDVGAQMLDLQNHELARAWLDISPSVSAAIYSNEVDELTVLTRDGRTQLLLSSPYVEQLDRCIVYLDDAHTRGTDIIFPSGFRAAVTLGPKVTKDRLAQGCMRMRKLGHGHSIMFFAPREVDRRIRSLAGNDKNPAAVVDTVDILHWAVQETWENIERWAPHWAQQGMEHKSRYAAWNNFCRGGLTSEELSNKWLQPETKTLEDLYEPRSPSNPAVFTNSDIRQRCIDLGVRSLCSVGMDEEQERELVYEVRHEHQVGRPSRVLPANHSIHQDVIDFVKTGVISTRNRVFGTVPQAFIPAFETLNATSATNEAFIWGHSVLVTTDFKETVQTTETIDEYLRPVHWIVSAKRASGDMFVILSPYEANCLLPDIRSSNKVHLHLYIPRITKSVKPHDDLALYSTPTVPNGWITPSSLMDQLNVFAGQLYLKDYETYIRLCRFLCVYSRDLESEEGVVVEPDGFILPKNRRRLMRSRRDMGHTFAKTPLVAIKALLHLRSKGVDITSTHMGKIVHGHLLSREDFDD